MKTVHFIYKEQTVDFLPTGENNLMVNATQMAKIFRRQVVAFLRNDDTKNFISECLKSENSHFLGVKNETDLIYSKQKTGTWMHRVLALKFAAWLDPAFELWVYITIDKILLGHYREQQEATKEKLKAERDLKIKKLELLKKYPEFGDFLTIEEKIKKAQKRRNKAIKESINQLKLDLFDVPEN